MYLLQVTRTLYSIPSLDYVTLDKVFGTKCIRYKLILTLLILFSGTKLEKLFEITKY